MEIQNIRGEQLGAMMEELDRKLVEAGEHLAPERNLTESLHALKKEDHKNVRYS